MPQPHFGFGAPAQARVNWQERLEQGFQGRHAQRMQNRGVQRGRRDERMAPVAGPSAPVSGWGYQPRHEQMVNYGGQQQGHNVGAVMGRQERYAEEERQHAAHLCNIRLQNEAQKTGRI